MPVKSWFRDGVKLRFVGVNHQSHQHAPQFTQKMEAVRGMLSKALGKEDVEQYLTRPTPHAIQFPNHKSVENYARFVQEELESCEKKGVIKKWTLQEPPTVVIGLKVVDDKPEKLRLCLVPMYINSFMAYEPVKYEQLQDLVDMIEKEDYLIFSDDKSGFWQVPLHPSMWQYCILVCSVPIPRSTVHMVCQPVWHCRSTRQVYYLIVIQARSAYTFKAVAGEDEYAHR